METRILQRLVMCPLAVALYMFTTELSAQPANRIPARETYRHALDFSPMSPMMNIYAIHYYYSFTPKDVGIIGPSYMRIQFEGIGHTDAPGFIIGYRRYLWRGLHLDYQLMPMWDQFYEENEDKTYQGFDLWNEFRFGYVFDFNIGKMPAFVSVQWPFGFALYSDPDGKPQSFKDHAEENPYFYFPPLLFVGLRF